MRKKTQLTAEVTDLPSEKMEDPNQGEFHHRQGSHPSHEGTRQDCLPIGIAPKYQGNRIRHLSEYPQSATDQRKVHQGHG